MDRILILGGSGMLGHKLIQVFSSKFETAATIRQSSILAALPESKQVRLIEGVDAMDLPPLIRALHDTQPTVVINCIGVIKQKAAAKEPISALSINSLFPHKVAELCMLNGARFIHISTDCVFSGKKGNYTETDVTDAEDLYGRSKLLGEVVSPHALTLRTSIIGPELTAAYGLFGWFVAQKGKTVTGYRNAVFSGLPTVVLANCLAKIITEYRSLSGLYHLSADPIDKFTLLSLIKDALNLAIEIKPDAGVRIDRSLNSSLLRGVTDLKIPNWTQLVALMADDFLTYKSGEENR